MGPRSPSWQRRRRQRRSKIAERCYVWMCGWVEIAGGKGGAVQDAAVDRLGAECRRRRAYLYVRLPASGRTTTASLHPTVALRGAAGVLRILAAIRGRAL